MLDVVTLPQEVRGASITLLQECRRAEDLGHGACTCGVYLRRKGAAYPEGAAAAPAWFQNCRWMGTIVSSPRLSTSLKWMSGVFSAQRIPSSARRSNARRKTWARGIVALSPSLLLKNTGGARSARPNSEIQLAESGCRIIWGGISYQCEASGQNPADDFGSHLCQHQCQRCGQRLAVTQLAASWLGTNGL